MSIGTVEYASQKQLSALASAFRSVLTVGGGVWNGH